MGIRLTAESNSATDLLKADHRTIERVLDALEKIAGRMAKGGDVPFEMLTSLVVFSQTFVDRCHHGKEELCLFPCLESRGIPRDGPIRVMLYEHQLGREYVKKIQEALANHETGQASGMELAGLCYDYVGHLRQHIFKEENVLFRMGEGVMRGEDHTASTSCYERTEEERVGREKHEEMLRLAKQLEAQA